MNNLLKNTILILVAAFVISGLSACTKSANSAKTEENVKMENANSPTNSLTNETAEKLKSEYPPIPSALAKAEIKKIDDSVFKLEDKKGNVVLLNLWATWCGPCRAEMPNLIEMEDKFKDKKFEIIGLNTDDESVEDITKFAEDMKLNYQMAYADPSMMKELINISKFQGIPQSYLIDRDGNLRGVFLGGGRNVVEKMKATVEKVVNE